jgi:hypothetical protein
LQNCREFGEGSVSVDISLEAEEQEYSIFKFASLPLAPLHKKVLNEDHPTETKLKV